MIACSLRPPKYVVIWSNDCSQPALADCTTMLHVAHTRLPAVQCSQTWTDVRSGRNKGSKRVELLLVVHFLLRMEGKRAGSRQPYPHEKTILQRLVYAYITTYPSSEGAQKAPRALPPLLVVAAPSRPAQRALEPQLAAAHSLADGGFRQRLWTVRVACGTRHCGNGPPGLPLGGSL